MQHKRKKITHARGSETHGKGSSKKKRGAGHRGGRGNASSGKRGHGKLLKVTKGDKLYLGKHGFNSITRKDIKAINTAELQTRVPSLVEEGLARKEGDVYVVDLKDLGYGKLLAKGDIILKMRVTAERASAGVIDKVKNAGGDVIVLNGGDSDTKEI